MRGSAPSWRGAASRPSLAAKWCCSAVVELLASRRIPMIIQTGVGLPPALAARFPSLIVHDKPFRASALVAQLAAMIGNAVAGPAG